MKRLELLKRTTSSLLASLILLSSTIAVYADENTDKLDQNIQQDISDTKEIQSEDFNDMATEDLGVQLNDLYKKVGEELNIDYLYVKMLHLVAGGKAIYADQNPSIYSELTVDSLQSPLDIAGAEQSYSKQAPWAYCPDTSINRPNKNYLPDAVYNVASDVVKIMNERYYYDRNSLQDYFNALNSDVKNTILFCEAVLKYSGAEQEVVDKFYSTYEKILFEKEKNENVLKVGDDGVYQFKTKFKLILTANQFTERDIEILSILLSFDSKLAAYNDPDTIKDEYVYPYTLGYTSRENMMTAAMSVVGKVRYVWGGGHLGGAGATKGINPSWKSFFDTYEESSEGSRMALQPTYSWCPIHGKVESANGCLFQAENVYTVEQYVDSRKEIINTSEMETDKYKDFLESSIDIGKGINSHRLDGLDCSGYVGWVYNQIQDNRIIDSSTSYFIRSGGFTPITYGSKLLPGDVYVWTGHIVMNVGTVDDSNKSYVILEASPNMVKFGVMYYNGATEESKRLAINIAKEANDLIGGLAKGEKTHIYNMDSMGFSTYNPGVDGEGNALPTKTTRYAEIGRFTTPFIDENIHVVGYGKPIKDMFAQDIIQHTIDNLPYQYMGGITKYRGTIFNTDRTIENGTSKGLFADTETTPEQASEINKEQSETYIGNSEVKE